MFRLEDRKMLAEFAGWEKDEGTHLTWWIPPGKGKGSGIIERSLPHYESDPAAACSLLPKLAEAISRSPAPQARISVLCEDLASALRHGVDPDGRDVCRIIADAVRRVVGGEEGGS